MTSPIIITPRLVPGVKIGDAFIHVMDVSVAPNTKTPLGSRHGCQILIDIPGKGEFEVNDMQSGCGGFKDQHDLLGNLLAFLEAAAESYKFRMRTGQPGENEDLFVLEVVEWAAENADDIGMLRVELEDPGQQG